MPTPRLAPARPPKKLTTSRGRGNPRRHVLASLAAAAVLLRSAVAFHSLVPPPPARAAAAAARRTRGSGTHRATATTTATRATRLPDQASTGTLYEDDDVVDTSAVLEDLARAEVGWEGHEYGFDWYLEQARRGMSSSSGFAPLRMNFWQPTEKAEELSPWDTVYIILRNLGQMVGLPSVDNAPVAKIEKYTGSWLTFLQKVSNGRLEDLAGGPLFLMLEKYFLAEGVLGCGLVAGLRNSLERVGDGGQHARKRVVAVVEQQEDTCLPKKLVGVVSINDVSHMVRCRVGVGLRTRHGPQ